MTAVAVDHSKRWMYQREAKDRRELLEDRNPSLEQQLPATFRSFEPHRFRHRYLAVYVTVAIDLDVEDS